MPLVSVLLPVRDAAAWLPASLASLSRQTYADFEIVAVDDGSTDGSLDLLEREARREPRLRVLAGPPRGLPAALETARAAARGVLLARHDADDLSHRERLAAQVERFAHEPGLDVVGTRVRLFGGDAHAVGIGMRRWAAWHDGLSTHDAMEREAWIDSVLCHGTAMLRAERLAAVGGWRDGAFAEDVELWFRLFAAGARFAKLPRRLYAWRQRDASATRRDPRYARAAMIALKRDALAARFGADTPWQVVGTGASLATWARELGDRTPLAARHATREALAALRPPFALVFGSAVARARWRAALAATPHVELRDFVFVA